MLTYSFANMGTETLYEHLYRCLRDDIIQGSLTAGTKLPSKRSFAKNLGISVITIENTYSQLIAEGYLYSLPKKGYYVADIKALGYNEQSNSTSVVSTDKSARLLPETLISPAPHYLADFASNQTRTENFPFSIWSRLMRELLSKNQMNLMTNSPCGGILALRQAIANHLGAFHGMQLSPDQIVIGAGTEYLYGLILQLLGSHRIYAVENPGYGKISKIYESHHIDCRHIPLDRHGISISALQEQGVDIVHLSPSHHYPTGTIMPIARRYELLTWACESESRYILEDDYDSEFRLSGQPIPTLQSIDSNEKVIYMNTFTKTLASTIRISYMVLPKHLVREFYEKLSFYSCTVSTFEQYTLARFIDEGYFEKHLNRMRNFYRAKQRALLSCIQKSPLSSYATIRAENAGLHFLIYLHTTQSDQNLCKTLEQQGVRIVPLSHFYVEQKKEVEHTFVVNYSSIRDEAMEDAIQIIYRTIAEQEEL